MQRDAYIKAVKAKIDEISPFDEPIELGSDGSIKQGFIAANGDSDYQEVKPIVSYIDEALDKAAEFCLDSLPLSLLSMDIDTEGRTVNINKKGVGIINCEDEYVRPARMSAEDIWDRDCTTFITTSDQRYLLQQNVFNRAGGAHPVVAYNPEYARLELYSFPMNLANTQTTVQYSFIYTNRLAEQVQSHIEEYIVLRCAAMVMEILENANAAKLLNDEYAAKLATIIK